MIPAMVAVDGLFRDEYGRHLIPHGLNMVHKTSAELPWREKDFAFARRIGSTLIRLGVIWAYLEPEPGRIDSAYVEQVRQCLDWAHKWHLRIYLDMHQDCYSYNLEEYGAAVNPDALEWQAIADGLPHENPGSVWSDAYLQSPAVKRMFDNFWANRSAPDGVGLQNHYAFAWRELADRLGDHPALVGYDLINEPHPGTVGERVMSRVLLRGAVALLLTRGRLVRSVDEMISLWMDPEERSLLTDVLSDPARFRRIMRAGERRLHRAERSLLAPFYERVTQAIRDVDPSRLIMTEPFSGEFMGMRSSLRRPHAAGDQSAWVPHAYDIVVDTDNESGFSEQRLGGIVNGQSADARRRGDPCLIGEWGAFRVGYGTQAMADSHVQLFETHLLGDSYWCYEAETPIPLDAPYIGGLHRPFVVAAAGTVIRIVSSKNRSFTIQWEHDPSVSAPTVVYIPGSVVAHDALELEEIESYNEGTFYRVGGAPFRNGQGCIVTVTFIYRSAVRRISRLLPL